METYVVRRLEQAKLLTDPFKLKLLERFAGAPATTKQVADRMGEKAPRLYRHVDALVDEGLLTLVEEKPKRGTIERYYTTVADRFEVDPDLFSTSSEVRDDALEIIRSVLRDTESDLVRYFERHSNAPIDPDNLPMVMKVAIRGTAEEVEAMRKELEDWLERCKASANRAEDSPDMVSYRGLLAFYPGEDDG
jgi:DNA-binding transcriptional ArsR family regulator